MTTSKNFRISDQEWDKFKKICEENSTNASQEIRKFIEKVNKRRNFNYEFPQTSIYDFVD